MSPLAGPVGETTMSGYGVSGYRLAAKPLQVAVGTVCDDSSSIIVDDPRPECAIEPVTGNLAGWDVTDRLRELDLPVLVTSGRYDEMTSEVVQPLVAGISGAQWIVFEHSAHTAPAEEPEHYRHAVATFLDHTGR